MSVRAVFGRRTVLGAFAVAAMLGFGMSSDRQRSIAAGYRHHLLKPVEPNQLERLLDDAAAELGEHHA